MNKEVILGLQKQFSFTENTKTKIHENNYDKKIFPLVSHTVQKNFKGHSILAKHFSRLKNKIKSKNHVRKSKK